MRLAVATAVSAVVVCGGAVGVQLTQSATPLAAPAAMSTAATALPASLPAEGQDDDAVLEAKLRWAASGPFAARAQSVATEVPPLPEPPSTPPVAKAADPVTTDTDSTLVAAYWSAVKGADPACHLTVPLLAAIGQVESGSLGGRALDAHHRVVPPVLGPVLDGHGFAAIADTDGGKLDGNTTWDRAVGPMQFIPSTWARWGRDGDGDGVKDPQDVYDAAAAAAAYLCAGGRDLADAGQLTAAIRSYNNSGAYVAVVLRWMRYFEKYGLGGLGSIAIVTPNGSTPSATSTSPPIGTSTPSPTSTPTSTTATKSPTSTTTPPPTSTTPPPTSTTPSSTTTSTTAPPTSTPTTPQATTTTTPSSTTTSETSQTSSATSHTETSISSGSPAQSSTTSSTSRIPDPSATSTAGP